MDFMSGYYGLRPAEIDPAAEVSSELLDFAGDALPRGENGKISVLYDFSSLRDLPLRLKLDVGAAAYWSEIAATQTMDNLLAQGHIDVLEYLERVPDGYITDRQGLINAITARRAAEGAVTPDCTFGDCTGCGACPALDAENELVEVRHG